jgi:hypothetical protein
MEWKCWKYRERGKERERERERERDVKEDQSFESWQRI